MIFGLPEETDEKLTDKVADVFSAIGERGRAVKVTLSSYAAVHQILIKARKLKTSENYGKVFICPDLSEEQRTEHGDGGQIGGGGRTNPARSCPDQGSANRCAHPTERTSARGGATCWG